MRIVIISNVESYGPLSILSTTISDPWIWEGDFNIIRSMDEKQGGARPNRLAMRAWRMFLLRDSCSLGAMEGMAIVAFGRNLIGFFNRISTLPGGALVHSFYIVSAQKMPLFFALGTSICARLLYVGGFCGLGVKM